MSTTLDHPIPGRVLSLCASCTHRTPDLSHPSPCSMVRWDGPRHVKPHLDRDGDAVVCSDCSPAVVQGAGVTPILEGVMG
jgi:hypothetical protein